MCLGILVLLVCGSLSQKKKMHCHSVHHSHLIVGVCVAQITAYKTSILTQKILELAGTLEISSWVFTASEDRSGDLSTPNGYSLNPTPFNNHWRAPLSSTVCQWRDQGAVSSPRAVWIARPLRYAQGLWVRQIIVSHVLKDEEEFLLDREGQFQV